MNIFWIALWVLIIIVLLLIIKLVFEIYYVFPCGRTIYYAKLYLKKNYDYGMGLKPRWTPFSKYVRLSNEYKGEYRFYLKDGKVSYISYWGYDELD